MDKAHASTAKHAGAGRMHMKSHRRHTAGMHSMGPRSASHPTDNVADQLNRDEAQRLSGSSMPPQQMQPMPSSPMQQSMPQSPMQQSMPQSPMQQPMPPSHMQQPMYQGR